jgi:methionyl-tRNA synthetase
MSSPFYLTTPLYYVNGSPHVGHTYTSVIADALARYKRMCGLKVCFLTGTDEHGLKIERTARQQGVSPQELADRYAGEFEGAWQRLGISCDEFIRTTQKRHRKAVVEIFERIKANRHIYLGEYTAGSTASTASSTFPRGRRPAPIAAGRPSS